MRLIFKRLEEDGTFSTILSVPLEGVYVFKFVEGDNENFDFGIDYLECASRKFLAAKDALELAPYICVTDILQSEKFGWGLTRTMTLAEGGEKCDFRFKKGGKTNITSTVLAKRV